MLWRLDPEQVYCEIHPQEAARLGVAQGDRLCIASRRAEITAMAFLTPTVQPGQVFLPMRYVEVNRLTRSSFDPYSRQPSYKHCAVRLSRAAT